MYHWSQVLTSIVVLLIETEADRPLPLPLTQGTSSTRRSDHGIFANVSASKQLQQTEQILFNVILRFNYGFLDVRREDAESSVDNWVFFLDCVRRCFFLVLLMSVFVILLFNLLVWLCTTGHCSTHTNLYVGFVYLHTCQILLCGLCIAASSSHRPMFPHVVKDSCNNIEIICFNIKNLYGDKKCNFYFNNIFNVCNDDTIMSVGSLKYGEFNFVTDC